MGTRAATGPRVYLDFVPSHTLVQDEGIETLVVDELSGFKKQEIRVLLDNYGKLRISGQRPLADNNQWSRFGIEYQVPEDCNVTEIQAKFENGRLSIRLPKLITEARVKDRPAQAQEPKEIQKPTREPKPSTGKDDINQKATPKPSVEPNGVPKKKEDEKRGEPTDKRKDAEKVEEKEKDQAKEKKGKEKIISDVKHEEGEKVGEKDQTEENKGKEKVTTDVKREEGEKGGAVTDVPKKEATTEREAPGNGQYGLWKLMPNIGELGLGFHKPRQAMLNVIVAVVILVGVGLYVTYKLRSPMEEDGH